MTDAELNTWVSTWIEYQRRFDEDPSHLFWAVEIFETLNEKSPVRCWEAILKILEREPTLNILEALGAGPLEDLIEYHGPAFIERIEAEARRNENFRTLLSTVWESSTPEVWSRIQKAAKEKHG